jgi:hypothetical protein
VVTFPVSDAARLIDAVKRTAANEEAIKAEIASGAQQQKWLERVLAPHGL